MFDSTVNRFAEILVDQQAENAGMEFDSYELRRDCIRAARPVVAAILNDEPEIDMAELASEFAIRFYGN